MFCLFVVFCNVGTSLVGVLWYVKVLKINEGKNLDFKHHIFGTGIIIPSDLFHMTSCRRLRLGEVKVRGHFVMSIIKGHEPH